MGIPDFLAYARAWCWGDIICSSHGALGSISELQILALGILILFFTGMLAVALQRGEAGTRMQAVFAGVVSGCMIFLINELHLKVSYFLSHGCNDFIGELISQVSYDLVNYPVPMLFLALMMAALSVLGALIFFSSLEKAATPEESARASRMVLGSTALIILVLLVVPPLVAHLMLGAGMIEVSPSAAMAGTVISVERTAPDAIVLTAREMPADSALATPPFSVYIDGVDVSNASAVAASGLAVTVEPANGLQAVEGSQATWRGTAVMNNGTPVSVVVVTHGADGSDLVVLDCRI